MKGSGFPSRVWNLTEVQTECQREITSLKSIARLYPEDNNLIINLTLVVNQGTSGCDMVPVKGFLFHKLFLDIVHRVLDRLHYHNGPGWDRCTFPLLYRGGSPSDEGSRTQHSLPLQKGEVSAIIDVQYLRNFDQLNDWFLFFLSLY